MVKLLFRNYTLKFAAHKCKAKLNELVAFRVKIKTIGSHAN